MQLKLAEIKRHAKEYVEIEARTKVLKGSFVKRHYLFDREEIVLSALTTDKKDPEWWVIGGSTPMNLYSKKDFPEHHLPFSLHQRLMLQLTDRTSWHSNTQPEPH